MSKDCEIAIVGAGPYGLSIAAHLRARNVEHRIIGEPMEFWLKHMPKGMFLKSDGFASSLYDEGGHFPLRRYCEQRNIKYADLGVPVRIEDFCTYGLAFQQRFAPGLINDKVTKIDRVRSGFTLTLTDGTRFRADKVIVATGLTHFENVPPELAHLPKEFLSHSSDEANIQRHKDRDLTVVGGGGTATELATLLHEANCNVRVIARKPFVTLHTRMPSSRTTLESIRRPISPIGSGWRARFFTDWPQVFHRLPKSIQNRLVKGVLGPSGGWFLRGRFEKVPLLAGYEVQRAEPSNGRVVLWLKSESGDERRIETGHVIAATGYRSDIRRLPFLSDGLRSQLNVSDHVPMLTSHFESSLQGLFFVGAVATNDFGPTSRFACGAKFAAARLSNYLARSASIANRRPEPAAAAGHTMAPRHHG